MPISRLAVSLRRYNSRTNLAARQLFFLSISLFYFATTAFASVRVITAPKATPREQFGASRLKEALASVKLPSANASVVIGVRSSSLFSRYNALAQFWPGAKEAFILRRLGNTWIVAGSDPSGVLYGSLELASRIRSTGNLPAELDLEDHPSLRLRGTCIGMQKTEIIYDGAQYDYPYTPQNFPFFYDKEAWTKYLDFLVENRMNTLYLWNGHPFTSILKLPRYPEAQELPDAQIDQNIAMYHWLTQEADRRGIWLVQGFYNIHLSHAFARAHNVNFQLREPTPLSQEYTRYVISEFIRNYPNVGLLITLGEAMAPQFGAEWLSETIIPGVKDGMKALGITEEPPIVVRAHATDIDAVMAKSLPLYHNLDTMEKWNGESLTWFNVRGEILEKMQRLSEEAITNVANIHLLSNLEPFRWGDPDFVRKCILSFQKIGIGGVHLYPLRYWDWPYSADNTEPLLQQTDRDWIWFEAWARYAWNPNRDAEAEHRYWADRIGERYGSKEAGEKLLAAYEYSGICAPELLPRIAITEGNREAFSLGLLMTQLTDDIRYSPAPPLWLGDAPPGERLTDYVAKEQNHQPHEGQTPIGIAKEVEESSTQAVKAAEEAGQYVTRNREEYQRLLNDMRCIHVLMQYYNAKTQAAALVLRYSYDQDINHLKQAQQLLASSVESFRQLVALTDKTYRQACSVHTPQRRIPFLGGPGKYTHWRDVLPEYEKELAIFTDRLQWLEQSAAADPATTNATYRLPQVQFHLESTEAETFTVKPEAKLYADKDIVITNVAPELDGLTGIRIPQQTGKKAAELNITLEQPAQILVGFFKNTSNSHPAAKPSNGEWKLQMLNAVNAKENPAFAVWSRLLPAGKNVLNFGSGSYVVLGFISPDASTPQRVNFFQNAKSADASSLDWFFED